MVSSSSLAAEPVALQFNQPAPFEGVLFSVEQANKLRLLDLDYKFALKENDILKQENKLLTDFNIKSQEQIALLAQEVSNKDSFWKQTLYFLTGALITGAMAYGMYHVR